MHRMIFKKSSLNKMKQTLGDAVIFYSGILRYLQSFNLGMKCPRVVVFYFNLGSDKLC